nr:hypothetical protein [Chitinophaga flava]
MAPNILSELKFNQVTALGVYAEGVFRPFKRIEIQGHYQKNGTISGTVHDADYNGDNRSKITYDEYFQSNQGHLEAFSARVVLNGLIRKNYTLNIGIGYNNTQQNYFLLSPDNEKLRTTYLAKWRGPTLSAGGKYHITQSLYLEGVFTFGLLQYNAVANWNLAREFQHPVSFKQEANGNSLDVKLGIIYQLNTHLGVMANGVLGRSTTKAGTDIAYLSNNAQVVTQFNGAHSRYARISMGIIFGF